MTHSEILTAAEKLRGLRRFDPVHDAMENCRARFIRLIDDAFVELANNDGRPLPDYRHVTQVRPMA